MWPFKSSRIERPDPEMLAHYERLFQQLSDELHRTCNPDIPVIEYEIILSNDGIDFGYVDNHQLAKTNVVSPLLKDIAVQYSELVAKYNREVSRMVMRVEYAGNEANVQISEA